MLPIVFFATRYITPRTNIVSHILICFFLIYHCPMIISLHQGHYHHFVIHYPIILFFQSQNFFSNPNLHIYRRTNFTNVWTCSRFFLVLIFGLVLVIVIFLLFSFSDLRQFLNFYVLHYNCTFISIFFILF